MSYGGQSNDPWGRNVMQGHPQSGGFHQNSQQMFMQNAQQNNMGAFGHGGMQGGGSGNMFPSGGAVGGGNSVAYPQPRSGLNPVAFQQGGGGQSHYNSIGTVTKISNDCGLVNDEIFFYRNVCKGPEPQLGERVLFEASYSNNGQFKWNATRIQLMPQHQQLQPMMGGSNKGNYTSVDYQRGQMRHNSPKRSPIRGGIRRHDRDRVEREREHLHRSRDRDEDDHERKRRREDHDRSRDRVTSVNRSIRSERERDRGESGKKEREGEREHARDKEVQHATPKGRRARTIRRYTVQIPKALLSRKTVDVQDMRQLYTSLYIPSSFFYAGIKWCDTFTPDNPFALNRPCQFHIMDNSIDPPIEQQPDLLHPADANFLYSAKVLLMELGPIAEIYKKSFGKDDDDDDTDNHGIHPSRLISFLVGTKGHSASMAIGGPWSPSLDGENPDKDPAVLIRTAIRTCKALTGIDLSNCTQWHRFVELYYYRSEFKNTEKGGLKTVVIYLPDVHSCMPSIEEWQKLSQVYKNAADDVIVRRKALVDAAAAAAAVNSTDDVEMLDNSTLVDDEANEKQSDNDKSSAETAENNDDKKEEQQEDEKMDDSTVTISDEESEADINDSGAIADDAGDENADANVSGGAAEVEQTNENAAEAADQNVTAQDGDDIFFLPKRHKKKIKNSLSFCYL